MSYYAFPGIEEALGVIERKDRKTNSVSSTSVLWIFTCCMVWVSKQDLQRCPGRSSLILAFPHSQHLAGHVHLNMFLVFREDLKSYLGRNYSLYPHHLSSSVQTTQIRTEATELSFCQRQAWWCKKSTNKGGDITSSWFGHWKYSQEQRERGASPVPGSWASGRFFCQGMRLSEVCPNTTCQCQGQGHSQAKVMQLLLGTFSWCQDYPTTLKHSLCQRLWKVQILPFRLHG